MKANKTAYAQTSLGKVYFTQDELDRLQAKAQFQDDIIYLLLDNNYENSSDIHYNLEEALFMLEDMYSKETVDAYRKQHNMEILENHWLTVDGVEYRVITEAEALKHLKNFDVSGQDYILYNTVKHTTINPIESFEQFFSLNFWKETNKPTYLIRKDKWE